MVKKYLQAIMLEANILSNTIKVKGNMVDIKIIHFKHLYTIFCLDLNGTVN